MYAGVLKNTGSGVKKRGDFTYEDLLFELKNKSFDMPNNKSTNDVKKKIIRRYLEKEITKINKTDDF